MNIDIGIDVGIQTNIDIDITVSGHMFLRFCVKLTFYMSITDIFTMLLIKQKI